MYDARQRLKWPAIGLILTSAFALLAQPLVFLVQIGLATSRLDHPVAMALAGLVGPQSVAVTAVFCGVGFLFAVLILAGATGMLGGDNYGLAITASVLAIIPCTWSLCFIGPIFGVWALIELGRPEVRAAFD